MGSHYLDSLFSPRAVAVFGASERPDAVGRRVYENLMSNGFDGPVYPINPKHKELLGQRCFPALDKVDGPIDLAVIATPASTVPDIIHQCGAHDVRAVIIISAGFSEGDGHGATLEKAMLDAARQHNIRVLGPNCLGLIRPSIGMNATFSKNAAAKGQLALISQSGALCTAILDWAAAHDIGFSAIVSLGNAADIDFGDLLDFLAQDPETRSILLYIEGIRDARSFMSGLRIASRLKPVVVIKAGRHQEGSKAATTHTGAMIGSDDVFDAALQRAGVIRARTIDQLFSAAQLLAMQCRVGGNRLAIITNGGGLGVMATDRAIDLGIELATLGEDTLATLDASLPAHWSHGNPIDLLGDAPPQRYREALTACLQDDGVDGILVMLSPQAMTDPEGCARAVIEARPDKTKPVLACWMGKQLVEEANRLFASHHLPSFDSPESSVEAFAYLARFHRNQQLLLQVPGPLASQSVPDVEGARLIIESVLAEHRHTLSITESKAVLRAFRIPVTHSIECRSANEALVAAESLGYPVVMKVSAPQITHKSDVGGVRLNIGNAHTVRSTYQELMEAVRRKVPDAELVGVTVEPMHLAPHGRELLVGASRDPVFGTAIAFGAGGVEVEALQDRAVALPPLNTLLTEQLIDQTRVARLLGNFRDMPAVDRHALVQLLRRVSEMVCELPEIESLDINPLLADEHGVMALDARIIVTHPPARHNHYDHMAIHPYPSHLVSTSQLPDGTDIVIRPIRPEDAEIEQEFVRRLSPQSKYFRFMQSLSELTQDMLIRFTQLDFNRELALIAVTVHEGSEIELGVARYAMNPDGESCEFALVVSDEWQNKGIGSRLMKALLEAARHRGFRRMNGEILANNHTMLKLAEELGFTLRPCPDDPAIRVATRQL